MFASLKQAHLSGVTSALRRFKLAGPNGADRGVAPTGDEYSHGTALNQYPPRDSSNPPPGMPYDEAAESKAMNIPDWLFNQFSYDKQAPGGAGGQFGEEVIG